MRTCIVKLLIVVTPFWAGCGGGGGEPDATAMQAPANTNPTYYVAPGGSDDGPGTMAAPWRTIQKAANTVSAGDTVVLMDGSYEEGEVLFTRSGTASQPITFRAQNKWAAILSSTSGCQPGFSIYASYIRVQDIRFSVSPNNITCPAYTSSNVAIRAWNLTDPTPENPSSGYVGFVADGIKVDASPARAEGVKSNQDFTIIENVESGNAIELFNNAHSIVRNNVVVGQNLDGVSIFAKGGVRSARIHDNVIRNKASEGYGIYLGGYSCDTCFFGLASRIEAYSSAVYNNLIVNDGVGVMTGVVLAGAKDSAVFNNTVIGGQDIITCVSSENCVLGIPIESAVTSECLATAGASGCTAG